MRITKKFLEDLNACQPQIDLFCKVFPDGCEVNQENAQKAIDAGLDFRWLLVIGKLPFTGFTSVLGDKFWYQDSKLHRTDGPAIEKVNGDKFWYQFGKKHRTPGPAAEYANGDKFWYQFGKLHRTDGPAAEYDNGSKFWYLNDKSIR